jgi:nitrite reductase (cytochrome c-552)
LFLAVAVLSGIAVIAVAALVMNIYERKQEAEEPFVRLAELDETTTDPRPWGVDWPHQYDQYLQSADSDFYGGSSAMPESKLEKQPWLRRLYAGYAFSLDYREARGHAYMLYDQGVTERVTKREQSGACLHCHASIVPTYRRVGLEAMGEPADTEALAADFDWPAVMKGFEIVSTQPYGEVFAKMLETPDGTPGETEGPFPMPPRPENGEDANGGGQGPEENAAAGSGDAIAENVDNSESGENEQREENAEIGENTAADDPAENLEAESEDSADIRPVPDPHIDGHSVGNAHPVSCIDCHDPKTMAIRVTRPGFMQGIAALAESDAETPHLPSIERWRSGDRSRPYDPNIHATRQEMRSYVCGQCHVEYYCASKMTLTFPWGNGLGADQLEQFWEEQEFPDGTPFYDWEHGETGAKLFKVQHPEFELWNQGIHARSGVSCADCHMPYQRVGAKKVSSHHVQSPMEMVNIACQTCHNVGEGELRERVTTIQKRNTALLERAAAAMTDMLDAIREAKAAGAEGEKLEQLYDLQRKSMWRLDYISSENSKGFHASQEAAKILAESIDFSRRAQAIANRIRAPEAPQVDLPVEPIQGVSSEEMRRRID